MASRVRMRQTVVRLIGLPKAIVYMYVVEFVLGALLYPTYRVVARPPLQDLQLTYVIGLFEVKENFAAIMLASLPAYLYFWRHAPEASTTSLFRYSTTSADVSCRAALQPRR